MMFDKKLLEIEGMRRVIAACIAFGLAKALAILGQALFLSNAIVMLWQGMPIGDAVLWLALFALCFVARQVIKTAQDSYIDAYAAHIADERFSHLLAAAFDGGAAFVRQGGSAALVANAVDGTKDIEEYVRLMPVKSIDMLVIPLMLVIAIFALDVVSGIIALVCYPFIIIFMRLIGLSAKERASQRHAQFERLSNAFVNIAGGVATLKAFGTAQRMAGRIFETSERFRETTMRTLRIAMLSSAVLDLFATLALAAVAIMLGFRMVEGDVAFFPALCVLVLVPEYFKPIREFGGDYHATLDGRTSLAAIDEFIERACAPDAHDTPFWPADAPWGEGIELVMSRHEHIAVTGPSGCGKTTLLNVLAGFADPPASAHIVVDGIEHETLREQSWRGRVAYIPQDPYVFHATMRDNLAFYNPAASDDEIRAALQAVGLAGLLDELPDGLDTRLGEGGRVLSGGQAQRVALCRALLDGSRDVWILDEPGAHLDEETERGLFETMRPLMDGKTVIVATHSPLWEQGADRVLRASGGDAR